MNTSVKTVPSTLNDWLDYISQQHTQSMALGLSRVAEVARSMQLYDLPTVVTIAGTNGKGSTTASIEAACHEAGLLVGATYSPHIFSFNERLRVGHKNVDDEDICLAFRAVDEARQAIPLTYFEYVTLAALWLFKQHKVEVAILEIGLGGRLDAFNIIDADVAVITSIGLDHQEFLGDTLEKIGAEKAGILRTNQRVVLGPDMPTSVLEKCCELDLQPIQFDQQFGVEHRVVEEGAPKWRLTKPQQKSAWVDVTNIAPQNLAVAVTVMEQLAKIRPALRDRINKLEIDSWPGNINLVGRLQEKTVDDRTFVLDVCHNAAGMDFLVQQLKLRQIDIKMVICGMLQGKDHVAFAQALAQQYCVPWALVDTGSERGLQSRQLKELMSPLGLETFDCATMESAISKCLSATQAHDAILVTGSFNILEQFAQHYAAS